MSLDSPFREFSLPYGQGGGRLGLLSERGYRGSTVGFPEAGIVERDRPGVAVTGANASGLEGFLSLDICVLSVEEAARLENYGIWPACKAHRHVKRNKGHLLVSEETHRFVGGNDTKVQSVGDLSMIVPLDCGRVWSPVQCHNEAGATLMGLRTWGLKPSRD